ncbi:hypothetical protein [Nonlabens sp. YIK11]|nr:hypothetical protein [Nonlabens sp. YIK11]
MDFLKKLFAGKTEKATKRTWNGTTVLGTESASRVRKGKTVSWFTDKK